VTIAPTKPRLRGVVGESAPRADAPPKVKGEFLYGSDLAREGMLYGATLRSPHAHARIVRIDVAAARNMPGVRAVVPLFGNAVAVVADSYFEASQALAALQKAIQWAWDTNQEKIWPLLHDMLERELLKSAMERLEGNETQIGERLEMARGTVRKRREEYGLK